jgi:hypothetical protein
MLCYSKPLYEVSYYVQVSLLAAEVIFVVPTRQMALVRTKVRYNGFRRFRGCS